MQRSIIFSIFGSRPFTSEVGVVGVASLRRSDQLIERRASNALPVEQFIKHQAQRINIALHGLLSAFDLFRRHVGLAFKRGFLLRQILPVKPPSRSRGCAHCRRHRS